MRCGCLGVSAGSRPMGVAPGWYGPGPSTSSGPFRFRPADPAPTARPHISPGHRPGSRCRRQSSTQAGRGMGPALSRGMTGVEMNTRPADALERGMQHRFTPWHLNGSVASAIQTVAPLRAPVRSIQNQASCPSCSSMFEKHALAVPAVAPHGGSGARPASGRVQSTIHLVWTSLRPRSRPR